MSNTLRLIGGLLLIAVAIGSAVVRAAEPAAKDAVFKMDEVSAFDIKDLGPYGSISVGGQSAMCSPQPSPEVKAYPKLKSKQRLYGVVTFGGGSTSVTFGPAPPVPSSAVRFHFVLDASEEETPPVETPKTEEKPGVPDAAPKTEASKPESKSPPPPKPPTLLERSRLGLPGSVAETKHDLLYFDANRDLDLTNDPPVKVMKEPPKGLPVASNMKVFERVNVELPQTPGPGLAKVGVLPILQAYGISAAYVRFVPATIRKGKVRLGNHEYTAILSYSGPITGRLDDPRTRLQLIPAGDEGGGMRLGGSLDWLSAMRNVDGALYQITATPSGDELRVGPYGGDIGVFKVAPANKEVKQCGAVGVFMSKEKAVMFGAPIVTFPTPEPKEPEHKLPVGDYTPSLLSVRVGKVEVSLRQNWYSAENPQTSRPPSFGLQIRKDKPLVLDFAQRPKVVFINPPADKPVRTGEAVLIRALLIESEHDLLIGGLEDTTRKIGELKYMGPDGKAMSAPRYASLDPDIVILDSSGKKVAEGKMPFG